MEIKIDKTQAIIAGVIVVAIVAYQEYTDPEGLVRGLMNDSYSTQAYGPNQPNPYGPQNMGPNPYGPQPQNVGPNPYGPQPQNVGPNPYGPQNAGPNPYGPANVGPNPGQNPYGPPAQPGYGPQNGPNPGNYQGTTDYTTMMDVDLGPVNEQDGW